MAQSLVVALLVAACALYAVWTLMPSSGRRRVAVLALSKSVPEPLARWLRPYAQADSGCACSGCDKAESAATTRGPEVAKITFHRRR